MNPEQGKILVAVEQGVYVIKFVGDVRLTMSASIDDFFQKIQHRPGFVSFIIDLTEADNLDSTTLGLLAKIAITMQEQRGLKPIVLSTNPDIIRLLASMGLLNLFDLQEQNLASPAALDLLPATTTDEKALQEKVIEAHKLLMQLSKENQLRFHELVEALEAVR